MYLFSPIKSIDPQLKPYYNEYLLLAKLYCNEKDLNIPRRISIQLSDWMEEGTLGFCIQYPTMSYFIRIQETYWNKANEAQRYQVIVHELSHCVMREGHSDDPHSYMYYAINDLSIEETNRQLVDFLSKKCNNRIYDSRKLFDYSLSGRKFPGML